MRHDHAGLGDIPGFSAEVWVEATDLAGARRSSVNIETIPKKRLSRTKTGKPR
jgi:hypothetical protein